MDPSIRIAGHDASAIAAGAKSQLRLLVLPQPDEGQPPPDYPESFIGVPHWVQETWQLITGAKAGDLAAMVRYRDMTDRAAMMPADKPMALGLRWDRWRPAIHMPQWASRLTLTPTRAWMQRVQDLSDEELLAEGVDSFELWSSLPLRHMRRALPMPSRERFAYLFDAKHGQGAYQANPWVTAMTFESALVPDELAMPESDLDAVAWADSPGEGMGTRPA